MGRKPARTFRWDSGRDNEVREAVRLGGRQDSLGVVRAQLAFNYLLPRHRAPLDHFKKRLEQTGLHRYVIL